MSAREKLESRPAGIPVFELHADNVDQRAYGPGGVRASIDDWPTSRVAAEGV